MIQGMIHSNTMMHGTLRNSLSLHGTIKPETVPKSRKISGLPPLTYTAKEEGTLKNYRIYGNTVSGESVGDRTGNLFDETLYNKNVGNNTLIYVPIYVGNIDYVTCSTTCPKTIDGDHDPFNSRYIFILSGNVNTGATNDVNGVSYGAPRTIQPSNGYVTIAYRKNESNDVRPWEYQTMLNTGSTALPYEPYGYKVPVMVSNGTDTLTTPIYLPEQIRKVGDEAEYIDYGEQKQHRVRVNLSEVNEFSNSITDASNKLNIWVQQGKNDSFAYPPQSRIFVITEPTAITTSITITNGNDSIRIKHNGSKSDIVIDIVRGLSPGAYSLSFNVLNYDPTTVGGSVINNIMVNKGSTALPYEPYIENTEVDVALPALPTLPGTNVLSVGTEVQPSEVEVTGRIRPVPTGGGE